MTNFKLFTCPVTNRAQISSLRTRVRRAKCPIWCGVTHPPIEERVKALKGMRVND